MRLHYIALLLLLISPVLVLSDNTYAPGTPSGIRLAGYSYNETGHTLSLTFELVFPNPGYIVPNVTWFGGGSVYTINFTVLKYNGPVIQVVTYRYYSAVLQNVSAVSFPLEIHILVNGRLYRVIEIEKPGQVTIGYKPSTTGSTTPSNTPASGQATTNTHSSTTTVPAGPARHGVSNTTRPTSIRRSVLEYGYLVLIALTLALMTILGGFLLFYKR